MTCTDGLKPSFIQVKEEMKAQLKLETWSLHFDAKQIESKEYQAIVLKNSEREIKLAALELNNVKTKSIATEISDIIENSKMIVADTTNVNTGKKAGVDVVVKLQRIFTSRGSETL